MGWLRSLFGMGERVIDRILPDVKQSRSEQVQMNTEELRGAPVSFFRLWRSMLGFSLVLALWYEVFIRPWMIWYNPELVTLPKHSAELIDLLKHMLGVGGLF